MQKTTRQGLQERQDTPLILSYSAEPLNATSNYPTSQQERDCSMPSFYVGSGYNSGDGGGMSAKHTVFVLGINGEPLTPTIPSKARKLLKGNQAKPVWNKFMQFGIQMLVETRKEIPKTALGVDFGTKFEGYAVVVDKENSLAVMWLLPAKKNLVKKLEERRILRRARRNRNCRRRQMRIDNRNKDGFIAPSQLLIVNSRLKCMTELFKCYPIETVALEDVKFNHRDNRWGKNFSTVEVGKKKIFDWVRARACLQLYNGYDTQELREQYHYKKTSAKSKHTFNSHCSDALAISTDVYIKKHISQGKFIVVDDTYRPTRRRLHDTQFSKGGIRYPYSTGNFKGIRKGSMCELGQMCGGTKNNAFIRNAENKRIGKSLSRLTWFSHQFKIIVEVQAIPPHPNGWGLLA